MATSSRIMHHVTKLKSTQTGFWNFTIIVSTPAVSKVSRFQSTRLPLECGEWEMRITGVQPIRTEISEERNVPLRIKAVLEAKVGQAFH